MNDSLNDIAGSLYFFIPEFVLILFFLILISAGLFKSRNSILLSLSIICFAASFFFVLTQQFYPIISASEKLSTHLLFDGMLKVDALSSYLKLLIDVAGFLTCLMAISNPKIYRSEFFALLIAAVLGAHLLVMTSHFLMIFISIEIISISSYILAGYAFNKPGSEGSLKYFLFGAVASSVMLYGFSIFYGVTGTLDFSSQDFFNSINNKYSPLVLVASFMVLSGFLYKIAAFPMHPWSPDVYEAAPIPVIAFLSVAPKLAGLGVLLKFILAVNLFGQSPYDWQLIIGTVSILTITVGNFSALWQQNPKRLMAYSSIAQSGFLLIGITSFLPQGIRFMLFYASIYLLMNFLVFIYLDFFEKKGITSIALFRGKGKSFLWPSIFLLIGLISLTGLPPTAGFTSKLFIFSSLWEAYSFNEKPLLLWLLVFGLINTVVSLFYYLRIPYFAFLKSEEPAESVPAAPNHPGGMQNFLTFQNLLGLILVLSILIFFFIPNLLMGWIKEINFVF